MEYVYAVLLSALGGFIVSGVMYFAGDQNQGTAILGGIIATALLCVPAGWYVRRKQASAARVPASQGEARIRAADSNDWTLDRIDAPGDQPFIDAKRSARWSIRRSRIGGLE